MRKSVHTLSPHRGHRHSILMEPATEDDLATGPETRHKQHNAQRRAQAHQTWHTPPARCVLAIRRRLPRAGHGKNRAMGWQHPAA